MGLCTGVAKRLLDAGEAVDASRLPRGLVKGDPTDLFKPTQ